MPLGLIVNVVDEKYDEWVSREAQEPAFCLEDGTPVWEVWFWHSTLHRWFVMSNVADAEKEKAGVVYFRPGEAAKVVPLVEQQMRHE